MAQLRDTIVSGSLRATDTIYSTTNQFQNLYIPTTSNGTTYGPGTGGQILKSNGTSVYWDNESTERKQLYFGTCDSAAASTEKVVDCEEYDALTVGDMIVVKFNNTNTGAVGSLTLNVNSTGAISIKKQYNNSAANLNGAGELRSDTIAVFCYNGTYWIFLNSDYNNTYSLSTVTSGSSSLTAETSANGGIGLHRYTPYLMTINKTWSAISCVEGSTDSDQGTAVVKIASTANYLLNSPILVSDTNTYVAPGNSANITGYTSYAYNSRYGFGTTAENITLTYQSPVYLVGIPNDDGLTFKLDSTQWWTQTLPTEVDEKIYIYLGMAYSASNMYLHPAHPIFYHDGTQLRPYIPDLSTKKGSQLNLLTHTRAPLSSDITLSRATLNSSIIKITPTSSAAACVYHTKYTLKDVRDKTFLFSVEAREVEGNSSYNTNTHVALYGTLQLPSRVGVVPAGGYDAYQRLYIPYKGDGWHRYELVIKPPESITLGLQSLLEREDADDLVFSVYVYRAGKNCPLETRLWKLEEINNREPKYMPALEDIGTELVVGTQTAITGNWTGNAGFEKLQNGQKIAYWLPYAGNGDASLNLTLIDGSTTGAIPIYMNGTNRLTTHYTPNNIVKMTYREKISIGGETYTGWWADPLYTTTGWIDLGMESGFSAGTTDEKQEGQYPGVAYRVENGNHIYVTVNIAKSSYTNSSTIVNTTAIPTEYCPTVGNVYTLGVIDGRYMCRAYVGTDGYIRLQWVQQINSGSTTGTVNINWSDIRIDYFID